MANKQYRCDYVPSLYEVQALLDNMKPDKWQVIAEKVDGTDIKYALIMEIDPDKFKTLKRPVANPTPRIKRF